MSGILLVIPIIMFISLVVWFAWLVVDYDEIKLKREKKKTDKIKVRARLASIDTNKARIEDLEHKVKWLSNDIELKMVFEKIFPNQKVCSACNGEGKHTKQDRHITWQDHQYKEEIETLTFTCDTCNGTGRVKKDEQFDPEPIKEMARNFSEETKNDNTTWEKLYYQLNDYTTKIEEIHRKMIDNHKAEIELMKREVNE